MLIFTSLLITNLPDLSTMRDIHMPLEPGWWPPAPGWWVLATLSLLLLIISIIKVLRLQQQHRTKQVFIKSVYDEFQHLQMQLIEQPNATTLAELNQLLKRVGQEHNRLLANHNTKNVHVIEQLTGQQWLQYLDSISGNQAYSTGVGQILADVPYLPKQQFGQYQSSLKPLLKLVKQTLTKQLQEIGQQMKHTGIRS